MAAAPAALPTACADNMRSPHLLARMVQGLGSRLNCSQCLGSGEFVQQCQLWHQPTCGQLLVCLTWLAQLEAWVCPMGRAQRGCLKQQTRAARGSASRLRFTTSSDCPYRDRRWACRCHSSCALSRAVLKGPLAVRAARLGVYAACGVLPSQRRAPVHARMLSPLPALQALLQHLTRQQ